LTFGTEKENLAVLKDYVEYLEKHHGLTFRRRTIHEKDMQFRVYAPHDDPLRALPTCPLNQIKSPLPKYHHYGHEDG
jgi:hypothetical protein